LNKLDFDLRQYTHCLYCGDLKTCIIGPPSSLNKNNREARRSRSVVARDPAPWRDLFRKSSQGHNGYSLDLLH
jgi:hypothetical protein